MNTNGNRKGIRKNRWLALALVVLLAAPVSVLADDTELFTTRALPNVLLILDTSGSMGRVDPGVTGVGDLDGNGTSNTRMDILWKVVYTLLNADLSIPSSSVSVSTTLSSRYSAGSVSEIRVEGTNWSSFPSSGTIQIGSGGSVDTVTYTSKYYDSSKGRYYFRFSPSATFTFAHSSKEKVSYSGGSPYSYPYPVNNTQAESSDFKNNITSSDEASLKARIGLMTFSSAINIRNQIGGSSPNAPPFSSPTRYYDIWNGVTNYANTSGATATTQALGKTGTFFTTAYDSGAPCRRNFAILITDGEDTLGLPGYGNGYSPSYYCSGTFNADGCPSGYNPGQVIRNNQVIQAAAAMKAAGYELFTVGVGISGNAAEYRVLREVLRRAAEQGGLTATTAEYNAIGAAGDNTARADGRAFFATDATEVATSLTNIFRQITLGTYSFTSPSVLSVRTVDRNELYLASFSPTTPPATFWPGSLRAYTVNADNTLTSRWNAATQLQSMSSAETGSGRRDLFTSSYDNVSKTWSRRDFKTSTISPADLGVASAAARDTVVNYIRGASHDNNMKLGDIFHSSPKLITAPSPFYVDSGYSTAVPTSGQSFVKANERRRRVIYCGANDGMLHAFLAGDWNSSTGLYSVNDTGNELFGYIPGFLLKKLEEHVPGPATSHVFFVDSTPRVADVWIDANGDDVKQSSEWRTVMIGGLRKGGEGYYALDITAPDSGVTSSYPSVLWEIDSDVVSMGETWSEPYIGKVKTKASSGSAAKDRFVAIAGGGKSDSGTIGRSLFVLDVATGAVLKQFTGLDNEVVASPTAVLDAQGYIKFVYVTDLSGNLYKFDFRSVGSNYGSPVLPEWVAYKIFQPSAGGQPSFNRAESVPATPDGSVRYIYFGTGDRENPITNSNAGKFYGIKDTDSFTGLILESTSGNLADLTGSITSASGGVMGTYGWKVQFGSIASTTNDDATRVGEKVLSDPIIFNDRVYFTTYTPNAINPCSGGGIARLYGLMYLTAGAGMTPITASPHNETGTVVPSHVYRDKGMPSSPALSINPGGQSSVFVGFSDGSYLEIGIASPSTGKIIRSWKEMF